MRIFFAFAAILLSFTSCGDSTITSEYDTVKAKKIILQGEDGKDYEITVDKEGQVKAREVR
jgi:hypothetical protein